MSGLEARLVVGVVGVVLATLGGLAAINFKDVGGRQLRWNLNRYGPSSWDEWGTDSLIYRSQLWCFRIVGGFFGVVGIVAFVMARV